MSSDLEERARQRYRELTNLIRNSDIKDRAEYLIDLITWYTYSEDEVEYIKFKLALEEIVKNYSRQLIGKKALTGRE